jgi:hypothetical protein
MDAYTMSIHSVYLAVADNQEKEEKKRNHPCLGIQLAQIPEKTLRFPSLQIPAGHVMVDLPAKETKHFVSLLV